MISGILNAKRSNVLLICVDDLRPELKCYGADYIHSPNIDRLAASGRTFLRHYVNAPSCGPSRYTLLTGRYGPAGNNALFQRASAIAKGASVPPSMPEWFRGKGYTTVSVGKVSHHPGGRGGADWDDGNQPEMPGAWDRHLMDSGDWKHPRGAMHGLSHGNIREGRGTHALFESEPGPDTIYPDGLIVEQALGELEELSKDEKPFFLAVGLIKPHLPFGAPSQYMVPYKDANLPPIPHPEKPTGTTTWHRSGEFRNQYTSWGKDPNEDEAFATEVRKHYAACVTYADASVGRILEKLESSGVADKTIVILWGDHGWHLGEHAIWGKHALFEESLHSPLIISYPGMIQAGGKTQAMVGTIDLFPTLCDLAGIERPDFIHGNSLIPHLLDTEAPGHATIAYRNPYQTIRTNRYRLIIHNSGETELYDHYSAAKETVNLANEQPEIVQKLRLLLEYELEKRDNY